MTKNAFALLVILCHHFTVAALQFFCFSVGLKREEGMGRRSWGVEGGEEEREGVHKNVQQL